MKKRPFRSWMCLIPIAIMANHATAGVVTPLGSNRTVSIVNRETIPQTQVSFTGPTVGPWQATAYALNEIGQPNANPNGSSVAITSAQNSTFDASGLVYSGFVFIDFNAAVIPNPGVQGTNICDATFRIAGTCDFSLLCVSSGQDFFNETTNSIVLRNDTTAQTIFSFSGSSTRSGTLLSGDYTLSIRIQGSASGPTQFADGRRQLDLSFAVPAPGTLLALCPIGILATRRRRRR